MPPALEVLTGRVTAPGAALTAWTPNTGVSLTVRNARLESKVMLVDLWANNQVAGTLRVRSPRLHDNVQGIRVSVSVNEPTPLLPTRVRQPLIPQDNLIVEQSGSAVAGQIETGALLLYYEDLTGVSAQLADYQTVFERGQNIFPVENTITAGATGDYTGERAWNSQFDLSKANTWYALIGAEVQTRCLGVGIRGVDTGNLRVMVPGNPLGREYTRDYYSKRAQAFDLPLIPVFNSANKFAILVDVVQDQAAAAVTVNFIMVELAPDWIQLQAQRRAA